MERQNHFIALLYGWVTVFAFILISSFILALLLQYTAFSQTALSWTTLIIGFAVLFIGGIVTGMKGKAKGWLIGGIMGFGFSLFIFLVQYFGLNELFSGEQMLHHAGLIVIALIGGIFGVNLSAINNK